MTLLESKINWVGGQALAFAEAPKGFLIFVFDAFSTLFKQIIHRRFRFHETVLQVFSVGVQSLPVVAFSLAFIALMMILEFSFHMKQVLHQDTLVPAFSTLLMLRELGPVVTCLLLTSRVGAGIGAEIGTMKVTDQLDALKLLSIDAMEFLVVPRWVACVLSSLFLTTISVAISIVAGAWITSIKLGYTVSEFFNTMFAFAHLHDGAACLIKAAVFGTILPLVASYQGFKCQPGSEGVGNAATSAVVQGSIAIIIADFIVTYLLYAL